MLLGETVELATAYKFKTHLENVRRRSPRPPRDGPRRLPVRADDSRWTWPGSGCRNWRPASTDLTPIAHAAWQLSLVVRYGDVRKFDPAPLLPLIEELFVQGVAGPVRRGELRQRGGQGDRSSAIDELNRVSLEHHDRVDEALWIDATAASSPTPTTATRCSRATPARSLLERGLIANDDLAREVSRRLSPGIPADLGAGWFEGLAQRNRYALLARQTAVGATRRLRRIARRRAVPPGARLPAAGVRRLQPREKRQICENLAEHWGV